MVAYRLYASPDGESHIESIPDLFAEGWTPVDDKEHRAKAISFWHHGKDYVATAHTAPFRHYMIVLEGDTAFQASDGTKEQFLPGDVILIEDTFGKGHKTWIAKGRRIAVVPLE